MLLHCTSCSPLQYSLDLC